MLFNFKKIILISMILLVPKSFSEPIFFNSIHLLSFSKETKQFENDDDKSGYALGVSLGHYINESFEKQNKIGIHLDKNSLLQGVQDVISGNLKLSHQEIASILTKLEERLKSATKIELEKNTKENFIKGALYMKKFSKNKNVKKTASGLLYLVENPGSGETITNDTKILLHYKGSFINGVEFDNSYKRGAPVSLMLKDVILGWQEGLQHIKKGGKITLVIPPHLAYGDKFVNGIPGNSTLIFNIELLDVISSK
jgi:FKBP-type peptidyl-prolyl cis-trans isomerase FkpA